MVDEADRLKTAGLEQLRDLYDRRHIGLVLIGMPGLPKRLARYAQLYSRVGFVHQFQPLSGREFQNVVERQWVQLQLDSAMDQAVDAAVLNAIARDAISSAVWRWLVGRAILWAVFILDGRGWTACAEGRLKESETHLIQSLDLRREVCANTTLAESLNGFAGVAARYGHALRAHPNWPRRRLIGRKPGSMSCALSSSSERVPRGTSARDDESH